MAKRLRDVCHLKEDEKLWLIGRGFVVRDLPWTEEAVSNLQISIIAPALSTCLVPTVPRRDGGSWTLLRPSLPAREEGRRSVQDRASPRRSVGTRKEALSCDTLRV